MKEEPMTDALLREFLLGKINDEERERIENLYLTDSQTRERVLAVEQDLIEDYLEDGLTPEDKARFLLRYAQTDKQRRNLRITRSIKDWAIAEAHIPQTTAAKAAVLDRLRARLPFKPVFVVPLAAMIVLAIVLAIILLNNRIEQRKHLAVEQELAQLNSPASLREAPTQMTTLELKSVAVRSVEAQKEFNTSAGIPIVELRLLLFRPERFSRYQAEVGPIDDDKFIIPNLEPEGGNVIRIRLPAYMLSRGHYQINLSGITADGSLSPSEEYTFAVSN
jgi:hypothetical protein